MHCSCCSSDKISIPITQTSPLITQRTRVYNEGRKKSKEGRREEREPHLQCLRHSRIDFASHLPLTDRTHQGSYRRFFYKKCINKDYTAVHLTGDQLFKTLWKAPKSSEAWKLGSALTWNCKDSSLSLFFRFGNKAHFRKQDRFPW